MSEEDVMGGLAGTPVASRFLGYYSKHGIELALKRSGLFDRLPGQEHPGLGMLKDSAGMELGVRLS